MPKRVGIYNVEPLRTATEIKEMKLAIKRGNKGTPKQSKLSERDSLIFLMGINTGLRVNDLVRLKVCDVKDKTIFDIREGKTNKRREINIGMLQEEIQQFITDKSRRTIYLSVRKGQRQL